MTIPGITFSAFRGARPITLEKVLEILGADGRSAVWRVSGVEVAPGPSADPLHVASDVGTTLTGDELLRLAAGTQVIEGEFEAHRAGIRGPWVLLRAVDGTSWDVVTDDLRALHDYERSFPDASPLL